MYILELVGNIPENTVNRRRRDRDRRERARAACFTFAQLTAFASGRSPGFVRAGIGGNQGDPQYTGPPGYVTIGSFELIVYASRGT